MGEGKFIGLIAGIILGAVIGGTIVYTILTLQALARAQQVIHKSSVILDKNAQGQTTGIHYIRE